MFLFVGLTPAFFSQFRPDLFHDFFESLRLIPGVQDCCLVPIIYQDVDSTAGKTDSTFEVRHSAIQISTVLATASTGPRPVRVSPEKNE